MHKMHTMQREALAKASLFDSRALALEIISQQKLYSAELETFRSFLSLHVFVTAFKFRLSRAKLSLSSHTPQCLQLFMLLLFFLFPFTTAHFKLGLH
jgi:hypothetical protein